MNDPSPENMHGAPVWCNYVRAQANEAMLGLIPANTLAIGLTVDGSRVSFDFELSEETEQDLEDMRDIVDFFSDSVGQDVDVSSTHRVVKGPEYVNRSIDHIYLARHVGLEFGYPVID